MALSFTSGRGASGQPEVSTLPGCLRRSRHTCSHVWGAMGASSCVEICRHAGQLKWGRRGLTQMRQLQLLAAHAGGERERDSGGAWVVADSKDVAAHALGCIQRWLVAVCSGCGDQA